MEKKINYDLMEYLFDEMYEENIKDYDYVKEYYDDKITEKEYEDTKNFLLSKLEDIKTYTYDNTVYLELNDNHTLWKIDNENLTEEDFEYGYYELVNKSAEIFKEKTMQELLFLGRSGRHVCIEYTLNNVLNYCDYQYLQEDLEDEIINKMNSYKRK